MFRGWTRPPSATMDKRASVDGSFNFNAVRSAGRRLKLINTLPTNYPLPGQGVLNGV